MQVIGEASNGVEAVDLYNKLRPDVAIIDLSMPLMNGIETISRIHTEFPQARLVVLTTYERDEDISRALQVGTKSYLLKDTPRQQMLNTIRAVAQGR